MTKSVSEYFILESFQVKSVNLFNGVYRLNADYYQPNSEINVSENIEFKPLSEFATVLFPGIFKRILVDNINNGIGFLTTSDMMLLEPMPEKFLSIDLTQNLDIYKVTDNTLLVSRSGTIGNTTYVNDDLIKFAISEDALRVIPLDSTIIGLLYFYFISDYGNGLITGKKSGAVIDHIYEDDLLSMPIPILEYNKIEFFLQQFQIVKRKRELANDLIRKARTLILQYNNLPPLFETQIETFDPNKSVEIRLVSSNEFTYDFRLDAHFYNPWAKKAEDNIIQFCSNYRRIFEVTEDIRMSPLFVRNFVENEYGVKYIAGKHIAQIRKSFKYISKTETADIEEHILSKGWTLMTCAGTLGKIGYVNDELDGATAQDLMRIVPNNNEIDGGYLNAWLSTAYGKALIVRQKYGAVVDRISPEQTGEILIPITESYKQREIGDLVRQAYDLRAEAIRLEDEAQKILNETLIGK
ncbi:MAG TPA: hypothetical protein PLQ82_07850 [Desulfobacteraceae bacterium]|nr:hypothetical protein [Desulfobacteraceae bacterium]